MLLIFNYVINYESANELYLCVLPQPFRIKWFIGKESQSSSGSMVQLLTVASCWVTLHMVASAYNNRSAL